MIRTISRFNAVTIAERRFGRREQSKPGIPAVSRDAGFGERRHVGERGRAGRRCNRERHHLAGADQRQHAGQGREREMDPARDHLGERFGNAPVGHVPDVDGGQVLEQLRREMRAAADPPEENINSLGFAFAIATRSLTDLTPSKGSPPARWER